MTLLDVRGLGVSFDLGGWPRRRSLRAVHDVSFTVARGETVGLVGESGSGKSTIAKLLTRLVDASAGQVLLDGEDVLQGRATTAFRRRVQMVFQDPFASLNPVHTVSHHLERPLRIHGHADDDCRDQVFDLLTQVGLSPAEE
jgi:peptide/nickel transport system ATP-binding protein